MKILQLNLLRVRGNSVFLENRFFPYLHFKKAKAKIAKPSIILYTAKTFIGFVFKYSINLATTTNATMKDTINPTINAAISGVVKIILDFSNIKAVAIIIVGIAKKNENSAAATLESPIIQPPIIVAAALENPGHKIDKH